MLGLKAFRSSLIEDSVRLKVGEATYLARSLAFEKRVRREKPWEGTCEYLQRQR